MSANRNVEILSNSSSWTIWKNVMSVKFFSVVLYTFVYGAAHCTITYYLKTEHHSISILAYVFFAY